MNTSDRELSANFEMTFTPDGVTTIVNAVCKPGPHNIEFLVNTGTEEQMAKEAEAFLQAWLDANARKIFGHLLN